MTPTARTVAGALVTAALLTSCTSARMSGAATVTAARPVEVAASSPKGASMTITVVNRGPAPVTIEVLQPEPAPPRELGPDGARFRWSGDAKEFELHATTADRAVVDYEVAASGSVSLRAGYFDKP